RGRRALSPAREPLLLLSVGRLPRLLRGDALPRIPRRRAGSPPGPDPRAGGGSDPAPPVPDHGRRDRDVRGLLVPAGGDRAVGLALVRGAEAVCPSRLRRACSGDA